MPLSPFEHSWCLRVTDDLISWAICLPFINMVDPEHDGVPDYLDVIKKPMALSKVRDKLVANKYSNVDKWVNDVNLIWENARKYNGDQTLIACMAMEAKTWFQKKVNEMPHTQEEVLAKKISSIKRDLNCLIKNIPSSIPTKREKLQK